MACEMVIKALGKKEQDERWLKAVILNRVLKEGFTKGVTFETIPEGSESES